MVQANGFSALYLNHSTPWANEVQRFLVEPRDQSRREGAVTPAVSRRAPARLLDVPSHAGASRPSILRREKLP